jgi:putative ABC transport system permease protein
MAADNDSSRRVLLPITTARSSHGDSSLIKRAGSRRMEAVVYSQLIAHFADADAVRRGSRLIRRLLADHHAAEDYGIEVPLELLEQRQRTQRIFSVVVASIAGISLLVGGIGIMNIMLATVLERTREIGIRRAVGARRIDIVGQFLVETVTLSVGGGLLGVAIGWAGALAIDRFAGMPTLITWWSVALSLGISSVVGMLFGIYPARVAARLKPIEALRRV